MFVFISLTVLEIQRFEISQNTPPPLILGKYCSDRSVQGRLESQVKRNFKRILTQVRTSSEPPPPDKLFSKTFFFQNISKTVRDIEKVYTITFVGLISFTIIYFLGTFWCLKPFLGNRGSKNLHPTPTPNCGQILFRLCCPG